MPPASFARLLVELERLPGIGPKSARRIAHHLLAVSAEESERLVSALQSARANLSFCSVCHAMTETDPCEICTDPARDEHLIAVVENPPDVEVLERTREFRGRYHVLGGALAPLRGIGPDDLSVGSLLERLRDAPVVTEVVIATNPNVEGEATALYLAKKLKERGVRVTRLAFGLPVGAALEYADDITLARSLAGRREI
ncbi:MAG: recombination mediator RecR [Thermoanaerobaculia bacterium]|nr:Recombination protein RecR [Thermoanaerobaculia bacterium]MCK6683660.1 recombination mediator RecR [Thermoanaerobaculia bacterium]